MKILSFYSVASREEKTNKKKKTGLASFVMFVFHGSGVRRKHVVIPEVGCRSASPAAAGSFGSVSRLLSGVTLRRRLAVIMDGNTLSSAATWKTLRGPGRLILRPPLPPSSPEREFPAVTFLFLLPAALFFKACKKRSCANACRRPQTCSRVRPL